MVSATPQWGTADAEILKTHPLRTQRSKVLLFKTGGGPYKAMRATHTAMDLFLANFVLFRSIYLHFPPKKNLSPVFPVLAVANTGSCVGLQDKIEHLALCYY